MRKLIAIFTMIAFVTMTIAPGMAHANTHNHEKAEQKILMHDCDHDHAKTDSHSKNNPGKKTCCDEGVCKCIGGACHNGIAKLFNNEDFAPFNLTSSATRFDITNEFVDSAFSELLKRPPKA